MIILGYYIVLKSVNNLFLTYKLFNVTTNAMLIASI